MGNADVCLFFGKIQTKHAKKTVIGAGCLKQGSEASGREGVVVRETHTNMLETHSVRQTYTKYVENTQCQTNTYKYTGNAQCQTKKQNNKCWKQTQNTKQIIRGRCKKSIEKEIQEPTENVKDC